MENGAAGQLRLTWRVGWFDHLRGPGSGGGLGVDEHGGKKEP